MSFVGSIGLIGFIGAKGRTPTNRTNKTKRAPHYLFIFPAKQNPDHQHWDCVVMSDLSLRSKWQIGPKLEVRNSLIPEGLMYSSILLKQITLIPISYTLQSKYRLHTGSAHYRTVSTPKYKQHTDSNQPLYRPNPFPCNVEHFLFENQPNGN